MVSHIYKFIIEKYRYAKYKVCKIYIYKIYKIYIRYTAGK